MANYQSAAFFFNRDYFPFGNVRFYNQAPNENKRAKQPQQHEQSLGPSHDQHISTAGYKDIFLYLIQFMTPADQVAFASMSKEFKRLFLAPDWKKNFITTVHTVRKISTGTVITSLTYVNATGDLDGEQCAYLIPLQRRYISFQEGVQPASAVASVQQEIQNTGRLQNRCYFNRGMKEGEEIAYTPLGLKTMRCFWKNDKKNGVRECYYPSGEIKSREEYVEGILDGAEQHYGPAGHVTYYTVWNQGMQEGMAKEWDDQGRLLTSCQYHQNQKEDEAVTRCVIPSLSSIVISSALLQCLKVASQVTIEKVSELE